MRAFEELQSTGFIVSWSGRGTFVADEPPAAESPRAAADPQPACRGLRCCRARRAPSRLGRADALARPAPRRDTIDLSRMQPSDDLLPHQAMRRCIDHVLRARGPAALSYAPREGLPKLRELIVEDLARLGVPARADDVLITTGSQQALDLVARALIDPGDTFLVEDATYSGAINLLAAAGARVIGVKSDDEGPDLQSLEQHARGGAKGFYLMPNCGNPTGSCVSARRREALVAWSHRAGVPLIEDDYGADLNLDGDSPPAALRALSSDVIYVATFSKKLIPALRVGFMVCPRVAAQGSAAAQAHHGPRHLGAAAARAVRVPRARLPARAPAPHACPSTARGATRWPRRSPRDCPTTSSGRRRARGLVLWLTLPEWMDPSRGLRRGAAPGRAGDAGRALQRERPRSPRAAPHVLRREARPTGAKARGGCAGRSREVGAGARRGLRAVARPASLV